MKKVKVLVNGYKGKMGSASVRAVQKDEELELVGTADKSQDLADVIQQIDPDVVVDFTNAESGRTNTATIIRMGKIPVVGTSGFTHTDVAELKELAKTKGVPGLIAPNFALGAVLMMKCSQMIAGYMPDVEIVETHHEKKLDAPSGTAVRTAELINDARAGKSLRKSKSKELIQGARGAKHGEVSIHSLRLPGHIAHQKVIFGGLGEILTVQHDSLNRDSFMPGVCLACKKIVNSSELIYGLEHLL